MEKIFTLTRSLNWVSVFLELCMVLQGSALAAEGHGNAQRPRVTGIEHVTIYVSDINKSRDFYSHVFGLTECPHFSGPDACFVVRPSGQRVLLKPAPSPTDDLKNWLAEIAFATDDLTGMRHYLLAHGASPESIQKDSDGSQFFRVRDPEGNSIAFIHRMAHESGGALGSNQIGSHLIHAGFVVKDMQAENRFYRDLLGFRLYWYGGFKDDGIDWYELQVADGPDWIEYMLNIRANADHKELGIQNHFSLGVKDVHAAAKQLRSNGLQTFDGPEVGRDGKDSLDAYDPDNTRIEVMEFKPVQKPCCHPYSAEHPKF